MQVHFLSKRSLRRLNTLQLLQKLMINLLQSHKPNVSSRDFKWSGKSRTAVDHWRQSMTRTSHKHTLRTTRCRQFCLPRCAYKDSNRPRMERHWWICELTVHYSSRMRSFKEGLAGIKTSRVGSMVRQCSATIPRCITNQRPRTINNLRYSLQWVNRRYNRVTLIFQMDSQTVSGVAGKGYLFI